MSTLCLVFLNYKTERALTNLRSFLSALEQLDDAPTAPSAAKQTSLAPIKP
ncbi:MAG: hypothetical protein AB3X44_07415 [Leptothrix sp. (in: b-proteobacteria)]